jgi:hypothetical protein
VKRILPLFDRVLVERFAAQTTSKGGIHLPEKSLGKVLNATVIGVGQGLKQKVIHECVRLIAIHRHMFIRFRTVHMCPSVFKPVTKFFCLNMAAPR